MADQFFRKIGKVIEKGSKKVTKLFKEVVKDLKEGIDDLTGATEKKVEAEHVKVDAEARVRAAEQAQADAEARAKAAEQVNKKLEEQGVLWEKALLDTTMAVEKAKALLEICDARQAGDQSRIVTDSALDLVGTEDHQIDGGATTV
jgi:membrane protein involved in colicin uptake